MNDVAAEVRRRAANRCEYCCIPEFVFRRPFHIEHIIAKQHGGHGRLENLALACWSCNLKKGPNLAGIDPETELITALYDPRSHRWAEHFVFVHGVSRGWHRGQGLTAIGRTTARVLDMNSPVRTRVRYELWREGLPLVPLL